MLSYIKRLLKEKNSLKSFLSIFAVLTLAGCQDVVDDLNPSDTDKRPVVEAGSVGAAVGQLAANFTATDTLNNNVELDTALSSATGVVLYFNMWCPICDSHMSHMRSNAMAQYPLVKFLIVDYVTGSVSVSRSAQISYGYNDFTVLVDMDQSLVNQFDATMGTTVVIDSDGVIRMNEDYKNGDRLIAVLEGLP